MGLLDHMTTLFLVFWGTSILFSIVAALICIPTNSERRWNPGLSDAKCPAISATGATSQMCKKMKLVTWSCKCLSSQGYGFCSGHVWMWELDYRENWAPKNWYFWIVVLEKTLESPLDYKEIQPVHPKEDQSWVFTGRTDVEAETPIIWPPDAKSWLIWEDHDSGKYWGQEEKGTTEDEMFG